MGKGSSGSWSSTDCKVSTSGGYRDKNYVRLFCTSIDKSISDCSISENTSICDSSDCIKLNCGSSSSIHDDSSDSFLALFFGIFFGMVILMLLIMLVIFKCCRR